MLRLVFQVTKAQLSARKLLIPASCSNASGKMWWYSRLRSESNEAGCPSAKSRATSSSPGQRAASLRTYWDLDNFELAISDPCLSAVAKWKGPVEGTGPNVQPKREEMGAMDFFAGPAASARR
jgi:hypothetical protein